MNATSKPFTIDFNGTSLRVIKFRLGSSFVYRVDYPNSRQPLMLVRAGGDDNKFWTSVHVGRQMDADLIGPLLTTKS
jgi:hypothetical protein